MSSFCDTVKTFFGSLVGTEHGGRNSVTEGMTAVSALASPLFTCFCLKSYRHIDYKHTILDSNAVDA